MSVSPMQLFEEQISSDDSALRLDAMRMLKVVGEALGPDETLGSLLPFLATHMDDDDEMLLKMAEELGAMVPSLVSGDKAQPVIDILEQLACVEETVVRNAAVASLTSVVGCMSPKVTGSLLDMVKRMSTADWFTGRVSACGVFGAVYEKVDAVAKDELRTLYKSLAEDETPMVRRSAAESLSSFATVVEKEHQPTDIVDIYKHLSQDEQDSVRQLAVKGAVAISKVISDPTANNNNVFPVVRNACNDKSWRVRHAVAKNYSSIASALQMSGDGAVEIIACFIGLLTDTEAEVRGAACVSIASMVEFAGESCFSTDIAPLLDGLSKDPVMEVRSKLSTALMDCTNPDICGKLTDAAILQTIQPILEAMLKNEEESDEVKINILRKLPGLSRVLSQMSEIVSVVVGLAKYQLNWRVRESVAKILPALAEAFGIEKFTSGNPAYLSLYLDLLQDEVADVRTACISGAYKIYEVACSDKDGAAWVQKNIMAATKPVYDSSEFYRTRITTLALYTAFCPNDATPKALLEDVVSNLLKGLDDPVPNVRMVAARGLLALVGFCDDNIINTAIKPQIQAVCDARDLSKQDEMDMDNDLRIYLRKLNTVLEV